MPYALLTLAALLWSGNFVLSRAMHATVPPVGLAFWRWMVALMLIAPLALPHIRSQWSTIRTHWKYIAFQGLCSVTAFNTLVYIAMQYTTAINAVLVNSCIPVLIPLFTWIAYREVISPRQMMGVMVSLGGVLLIIFRGDVTHLAALQFNKGDVLVVIAAGCWAAYSTGMKRYPAGLNPHAYLMMMIVFGIIPLIPLYLYETFVFQLPVHLNMPTALTVLYVALFASIVAVSAWNKGLRVVGANRGGPFIHLMPVFSTILAVIFLNESLYGYHLQGIALVFFGILLTSIKK